MVMEGSEAAYASESLCFDLQDYGWQHEALRCALRDWHGKSSESES